MKKINLKSSILIMSVISISWMLSSVGGATQNETPKGAIQDFLDRFKFDELPRYTCHLLLVSDATNEADFDVMNSGEGHGGEDRVFTFGKDKLTISVDHQFINLLWERSLSAVARAPTKSGTAANSLGKGKKIAMITSALDSHGNDERVLIAYDPGDEASQASIACSRIYAQP